MQKSPKSGDEVIELNVTPGSSKDFQNFPFKRKTSEERCGETLKGNASDSEDAIASSNKKIKQEDNSDNLCSNTKNLSFLVWGAHNTTMSVEERRKYLAEPPEWPESIRKIISGESVCDIKELVNCNITEIDIIGAIRTFSQLLLGAK